MASWAPALFGDVLVGRDGTERDTTTALAGKTVGIYFSAHWCPPCRGFTPQLAASYTDHLKAKDLEIVFVSSDRDEPSFKEYFCSLTAAVARPFGPACAGMQEQLGRRAPTSGRSPKWILNPSGATASMAFT